MKRKAGWLRRANVQLIILITTWVVAYGQMAPYRKAATPFVGNWPSVNSKGAMVWSMLDQSGYWQVWTTKQDSPFGAPAAQITTGNANHLRPVIDDTGTLFTFKTTQGKALDGK